MVEGLASDTRQALARLLENRIPAGSDRKPAFYALSGVSLRDGRPGQRHRRSRDSLRARRTGYALRSTRLADDRLDGAHGRWSDGRTPVRRPLYSALPEEIDTLRSVVTERSFPGVRARYLGMATSLYRQYLAGDPLDDSDSTVKQCLYALRGVLAAEYVREYGVVEPALSRLVASRLPEDEATTRPPNASVSISPSGTSVNRTQTASGVASRARSTTSRPVPSGRSYSVTTQATLAELSSTGVASATVPHPSATNPASTSASRVAARRSGRGRQRGSYGSHRLGGGKRSG
ncbi:MAG: DNA polymerase beta superfamily protein [Haloplanus sp.]